MSKNLLEMIFETSNKVSLIQQNRSSAAILTKLSEETGELATEFGIKHYGFYKTPGKDGIIGEAIDAILCLADLIKLEYPNVTIDDINKIGEKKLEKWYTKVLESEQNSWTWQDVPATSGGHFKSVLVDSDGGAVIQFTECGKSFLTFIDNDGYVVEV